jgi:uncharacterized protein DUF4838
MKNITILCLFCACISVCKAQELLIARDGKTQYRIVTAEKLSINDKFALSELQLFLRKSTGASFKKILPDAVSKDSQLIVLGKNKLSSGLLGKKLLDTLSPDEALVKTVGSKIVLVGGGKNGTLYAVYEFLENQLGCRWYTAYGDMKISTHKKLLIPQLNYRVKLPFRIRAVSMYFYQLRPAKDYFFARNRQNEGFKKTLPELSLGKWLSPGGHTLEYYIAAGDKRAWGWVKSIYQGHKKNYFKTNPEFFSMAKNGKRTPRLQLCFSNPELRKELTKNVLAGIKYGGGKGRIAMDANDVPGSFCYCPECKKLEKQYRSIIGPLMDYILELSGCLKQRYPEVTISFLAYRKTQTEVPPAINKLPNNIIVNFAEIDDNFTRPMTDKTNLDTLKNLKKWREITPNVIDRGYMNPYCKLRSPFGNIDLIVQKVRLAQKMKLFGLTPEHTSGTSWGVNFSDLQTWLFLRLCRNPQANVEKLVNEFTDYYYGAAAPLMRRYINELESLRKQTEIFMPWNPKFSMYRYLTPQNIIKWEHMFDQMVKLTANTPKQQFHVNLVRLTLDIAALKIWHKLKKEYPQYKPDARAIEARVRNNFMTMLKKRLKLHPQQAINRFNKMFNPIAMLATAEVKPLPKLFSGFADDKVSQVFPMIKYVKTADSACGLAVVKKWNKSPIEYGLYDSYNRRFLYPGKIKLKDIKPGKYHFYKLRRVKLTPDCLVWFTQKWIITFPLDQFYVMGFPDKQWDIYASLKFDGPAFDKNSKAKESTISFDRAVAVSVD